MAIVAFKQRFSASGDAYQRNVGGIGVAGGGGDGDGGVTVLL
jgi:hypothetical protein